MFTHARQRGGPHQHHMRLVHMRRHAVLRDGLALGQAVPAERTIIAGAVLEVCPDAFLRLIDEARGNPGGFENLARLLQQEAFGYAIFRVGVGRLLAPRDRERRGERFGAEHTGCRAQSHTSGEKMSVHCANP
ncbi:hypothetical protein ACHMW6_20475 [Pseudoduganella sp. UC29_106]|uniref:hypothetical protein n=1 Tax=Pseudoduganella sp. UC29_106 TaxID=3374553 RepID=UPI0037567758